MEDKKSHVGDWLEKLQRESWNLELLVSGFSIFLLIQAYEVIISATRYFGLHTALSSNLTGMAMTLLGISLLASVILTLNLIVHVFLRGFWIGAVGLRSVQSKIDLEKLGYSDFFTQKLKERVPSLDRMLEKLDTLSSVIFSFTFLIVFMFFSLFLYFSVISIFIYGVNLALDYVAEDSILVDVLEIGGIVILILMLLLGLIYAIDTLSLGFFKKYKWLSKIYYPIYKVIGVITMAGIYRSIYYSLISRFSKNKIRVALSMYLLLFFFVPFIKYDQYIFYPDNGETFKLSTNEYDDIREEDSPIGDASIPSQIIKGNFLPLFIRYSVRDNEAIQANCQDFEPKKKDGFNSGIKIHSGGINLGDAHVSEEHPEDVLNCLAKYFTVKIDSTNVQPDFYFYTHPNQEEKGVQAMLELENFSKGKHEIFVQKKRIGKEDKIEDVEYSHIVFWKE